MPKGTATLTKESAKLEEPRKQQHPMATSVQMARILQNTYMNSASIENRDKER